MSLPPATVPPTKFRTLGIDVGSINLGFCVLEFEGHVGALPTVTPISWINWDIVAGRPRIDVVADKEKAEARCCALLRPKAVKGIPDAGGMPPRVCDKRAALAHNLDHFYCRTHANSLLGQDASSPVVWTGPINLVTLRKECRVAGILPVPSRKEGMIRILANRFLFPATLAQSVIAAGEAAAISDAETEDDERPAVKGKGKKGRIIRITDKVAKNKKASLDELEEGAERFMDTHEEAWTVREGRIENQGAAHGASTKSLQIILYTLLKHGFRGRPIPATGPVRICSVNAEDKTRGYSGEIVAARGHEGYDARKEQAKEMVPNILAKIGADVKWAALFEANAKKQDDMADAFLMAYRLGMQLLRRDGLHPLTPALAPLTVTPLVAGIPSLELPPPAVGSALKKSETRRAILPSIAKPRRSIGVLTPRRKRGTTSETTPTDANEKPT